MAVCTTALRKHIITKIGRYCSKLSKINCQTESNKEPGSVSDNTPYANRHDTPYHHLLRTTYKIRGKKLGEIAPPSGHSGTNTVREI